jgi:tRNA pseudouridine38-40 synthase
MSLSRYALKIFYDGGGFAGSQIQERERTVEGEFISTLNGLEITYTDFRAAGRTDRGVSALGNVFALTTDSKLIKPRVINSNLPMDIRVLALKKVRSDFNPRHAEERIYRYFLCNEDFDLEKMYKIASVLKGGNSFHNFSMSDYRSPIRKINYIDIIKRGDFLILTFSGRSFLWQMVRRLVTALKMVGKGDVSAEEIEYLLDPMIDKKIPPSPAENLVFWNIKYDFLFENEDYSKKRLKKELEERLLKYKTGGALIGEILHSL